MIRSTLRSSGAILFLLLVAPPAVDAAGINLLWDDCSLGPTATTNRTFACNVNTGSHDLYASFDPPPGLTAVVATELVVDVQAASPVLPDWWQFKNPGSCRLAALSSNAVFPLICTDPWSGNGVTGIAAYYVNANMPSLALNQARILAVVAIPSTPSNPVNPGTEYYALRLHINNSKTVGTGSCGGCSVPVSLLLRQIQIYQPPGTPGESPTLTNPLVSNQATWQSGPTPTLNRTWGQIKSIYR